MNLIGHICSVISESDFNRWRADENLFLNIISSKEKNISYLITYEELYSEVIEDMSEEDSSQMERLQGDELRDFERDLISNYVMERDIYSYKDIEDYHSGEVDIQRHNMMVGEDMVSICFLVEEGE